MGLWIKNKDVACIFDNFLQLRAGAFEIFLRDNTAVAQNSLPNRLGLLILIWVVYLSLKVES